MLHISTAPMTETKSSSPPHQQQQHATMDIDLTLSLGGLTKPLAHSSRPTTHLDRIALFEAAYKTLKAERDMAKQNLLGVAQKRQELLDLENLVLSRQELLFDIQSNIAEVEATIKQIRVTCQEQVQTLTDTLTDTSSCLKALYGGIGVAIDKDEAKVLDDFTKNELAKASLRLENAALHKQHALMDELIVKAAAARSAYQEPYGQLFARRRSFENESTISAKIAKLDKRIATLDKLLIAERACQGSVQAAVMHVLGHCFKDAVAPIDS